MKNKNNLICNHNPDDSNCTLEQLPKKVMTTPEIFYFLCKGCKKGFSFIKNKKGEFVEN